MFASAIEHNFRRHVFEWNMVTLATKNGHHQNMRYGEIGLCAEMETIFTSTHSKGLCDHLKEEEESSL